MEESQGETTHSELVRKGMDAARAESRHQGRPKAGFDIGQDGRLAMNEEGKKMLDTLLKDMELKPEWIRRLWGLPILQYDHVSTLYRSVRRWMMAQPEYKDWFDADGLLTPEWYETH